MIAFVVSAYAFMEFNNYKKYIKKSYSFNNFINIEDHDRSRLENKINIIHDDIKNSHNDFDCFIKEMFRGFENLEEIPKEKIKKSFIENFKIPSLCNKFNEKISMMVDDIENIFNIKFKHNYEKEISEIKDIKHIKVFKDELITWYRPLLLKWMLLFLKFCAGINMKILGFNKYHLNSDVIIWKTNTQNDIENKEAFLFVPSCIGGITFYQSFFYKLLNNFKNKEIYILEVPGMAWTTYDNEIPPSISEIAKNISDFLVNNNVKNLDMFGHSFGTIVLNHIINEQYDFLKKNGVKLKKIINIEGLLFYTKVFKTLMTINKTFYEVLFSDDFFDIFTMPLFQRDIDVMFYVKRYLSLANSLLSEDIFCETECEFYSLMSNDDNKFFTQDYVKYIERKKLNIKYKIFNDSIHGSFAWKSCIQDTLIDILKT